MGEVWLSLAKPWVLEKSGTFFNQSHATFS